MSAIALNNPLIPSAGVPPANWLFATMAPSGTQLFSCTLAQIGAGIAAGAHTIVYVIDGGGTTISTGVAGQTMLTFSATIKGVWLLADRTGSIVVDIWKVPFAGYPPTGANSICASDLPTIATAQSSSDTALTGWTTAIAANDTFMFNVNSVTSLQRVTVILSI